jgi:MerR family transcriptional regulator, mercuric resistance operon regulatory protein
MNAITNARAEKLTIGELSGLTAVNIETIRYYERIKMLPALPRTSGGRRAYDANHLRILAFIRRSRELGFSLDEIRALIRLGEPARASCRQARDIASHHLDDIRAKIADFASWSGCCRKPSPNAPEQLRPIVPCWTFSISGAPHRRAYLNRQSRRRRVMSESGHERRFHDARDRSIQTLISDIPWLYRNGREGQITAIKVLGWPGVLPMPSCLHG